MATSPKGFRQSDIDGLSHIDRRVIFSSVVSFYHANASARTAYLVMGGLLAYHSLAVEIWRIVILGSLYLIGAIGLEITTRKKSWIASGDACLALKWRDRFLPWLCVTGTSWGFSVSFLHVPGQYQYLAVAYIILTVIAFGNLVERAVEWKTFRTYQAFLGGSVLIGSLYHIYHDPNETRLILLFSFACALFYIHAQARIWHRKAMERLRLSIETQIARDELAVSHVKLEQAHIAMEQAAITDRLTGLYNRFKLDKVLSNAIEEAQSTSKNLSIIIADVDRFKTINDTYGHTIGDMVLFDVAEILRTHKKKSDIVGRWGGEEFVIVCPDCDAYQASMTAENIRKKLEEHAFNTVPRVTSSFGIASLAHGDDDIQLIERADKALYQAKKNGRNRVERGLYKAPIPSSQSL